MRKKLRIGTPYLHILEKHICKDCTYRKGYGYPADKECEVMAQMVFYGESEHITVDFDDNEIKSSLEI
jgi:hypothetical protein